VGEVVLPIEGLLAGGEDELVAALDALDALVLGLPRRATRRPLEIAGSRVPQDDNAPAAWRCRGDSDVETAAGKKRLEP
jgi:hypothetical protein